MLNMLVFILPYSKKQNRITFKDCKESRFSLEEIEPFVRILEKRFSLDGGLAPLYRRFGGDFWESLELWVMPAKVMEYLKENSWVLSPIYGLLKPDACIPYAPIDWKEEYEGEKLFDFWKKHIKNLSKMLLKDKIVISFVPKKYLSLFSLSYAKEIVFFEYYMGEKKIKNPEKHLAYTLRYIVEKGLDLTEFYKIDFYDYQVFESLKRDNYLYLRFRSGGKYGL